MNVGCTLMAVSTFPIVQFFFLNDSLNFVAFLMSTAKLSMLNKHSFVVPSGLSYNHFARLLSFIVDFLHAFLKTVSFWRAFFAKYQPVFFTVLIKCTS